MFRWTSGHYVQEAYLKASNADASDVFGGRVAVSDDGKPIASFDRERMSWQEQPADTPAAPVPIDWH